jgi:hypothetical protein
MVIVITVILRKVLWITAICFRKTILLNPVFEDRPLVQLTSGDRWIFVPITWYRWRDCGEKILCQVHRECIRYMYYYIFMCTRSIGRVNCQSLQTLRPFVLSIYNTKSIKSVSWIIAAVARYSTAQFIDVKYICIVINMQTFYTTEYTSGLLKTYI